MSFQSTIQKTIDEIKNIESHNCDYYENPYYKIPTKYVLSLYRRCQNHIRAYWWYLDNDTRNGSEIKTSINYLFNTKNRLKKILDERENLK